MERERMAGRSTPVVEVEDASAAEPDPRAGTPLARFGYVIGSIGLLVAAASDAIAVAGRHLGLHLLGSIEMVQAAVVLLAVAAMLTVTMIGGHASVHIVTDRLSGSAAARLSRVAAIVSALVFLAFATGSAWLLLDLWNGSERTELLHIPLRWLRLLWIATALLIAAQFVRRAFSTAPR